MQNHMRLLLAAASAIVVGGTFACTGGGGSLDGALTTWGPAASSFESSGNGQERAPASQERAPSSEDGVGASTEPAPGAQGGGTDNAPDAFDCSGTYICTDTTKKNKRSSLTLAMVDGTCSVVTGSVSTKFVFEGNGAVVLDGKTIASWEATPSGFIVTNSEGSSTCTKSSSPPSGTAVSDDSGGSAGAGTNTGAGPATSGSIPDAG